MKGSSYNFIVVLSVMQKNAFPSFFAMNTSDNEKCIKFIFLMHHYHYQRTKRQSSLEGEEVSLAKKEFIIVLRVQTSNFLRHNNSCWNVNCMQLLTS